MLLPCLIPTPLLCVHSCCPDHLINCPFASFRIFLIRCFVMSFVHLSFFYVLFCHLCYLPPPPTHKGATVLVNTMCTLFPIPFNMLSHGHMCLIYVYHCIIVQKGFLCHYHLQAECLATLLLWSHNGTTF